MLPVMKAIIAARNILPWTFTPPSGATISDIQPGGPSATAGITFNENGTYSISGADSSPTSGNWIEPTSQATVRNYYIKYTIGTVTSNGNWDSDNFTAANTYTLINGSGGLAVSATDLVSTAAGRHAFEVTFSVATDLSGTHAVTSSVTCTVDVDFETP